MNEEEFLKQLYDSFFQDEHVDGGAFIPNGGAMLPNGYTFRISTTNGTSAWDMGQLTFNFHQPTNGFYLYGGNNTPLPYPSEQENAERLAEISRAILESANDLSAQEINEELQAPKTSKKRAKNAPKLTEMEQNRLKFLKWRQERGDFDQDLHPTSTETIDDVLRSLVW